MNGFIAFAVSAGVAALIAPAVIRELPEETNYRGRAVPSPGGAAVVVASLLAIGVLAAVDVAGWDPFDDFYPFAALSLTAGALILGVAFLGLLDDAFGSAEGAPRGWRAHALALREGRVTTGAIKALGTVGLALWVVSPRGGFDEAFPVSELLVSAALLAASTNLFNLFDTRPGRAGKMFVLLSLVVLIAGPDTEAEAVGRALAPFFGVVLVVIAYDLRERVMMGDTGSNLLGAMAGLVLVGCLGATGEAIALALILALTVLGEFRSLGGMIERIPLVRHLDSLGRKT